MTASARCPSSRRGSSPASGTPCAPPSAGSASGRTSSCTRCGRPAPPAGPTPRTSCSTTSARGRSGPSWPAESASERRDQTPDGWAHACTWRAAPKDGPFEAWREGEPLTAFGEVATDGRLATTWLAVRRQLGASDRVHRGPFALRLELRGPTGLTVDLVKSLVDGVVCALHRHADDDPEPIARVAHALALPVDQVAALLREHPGAILGIRRLVHRFGGGVQWNPADDDLVAAEVRYRPGPTRTVSGTVCAAAPR